jgi:hypothetical protein
MVIKPRNLRRTEYAAYMHEGKGPLKSLDTNARMVLKRVVGCEDD